MKLTEDETSCFQNYACLFIETLFFFFFKFKKHKGLISLLTLWRIKWCHKFANGHRCDVRENYLAECSYVEHIL